jgi:dihydrofolate reductase
VLVGADSGQVKRPKTITLVAAMARESRVIGIHNQLPWSLPVDLAHFKRVTLGKPVLMGRKTYESIGRPLPGRDNVILTRDPHWRSGGVSVHHDITTVLAQYADCEELMVIGGANVYQQMLPLANQMWLTWVDWTGDGDAFFPEFTPAQWRVLQSSKQPVDARNAHPCEFVLLQRR